MDLLLKWWPLIWAGLNLVGFWVMWSLSRRFVSTEHCGRCREDFEKRLSRVESDSSHAPRHGDLSKIYERLNAVAGTVADQGGELRAIRRSLDLINQHLLNKGA
ncbi:DUF2730 family protein [Desulfocurvibacter africanus]|uniref:DUF2730 family protein n=1 Tax=Desulfocurvibacter africanus TaxID=873 RepID=UPI00041B9F05|nr:DUF2730 family protein [Desulfocurvibacter africanus]